MICTSITESLVKSYYFYGFVIFAVGVTLFSIFGVTRATNRFALWQLFFQKFGILIVIFAVMPMVPIFLCKIAS